MKLRTARYTMAEPDPHQMMTCPYNPAHQVEHYRMHIHLQKCRKQHQNCNKLICPIDATHVVNDVELDYHMKYTCSKRVLFESQMYVTDAGDVKPIEVIPPPPVTSEENWDDENVTSYKPDPAKKGSHVLLKAKGLTPSERRKVRMEGVRTYRAPDTQ
ncbi:u11-48K-like CHHC zinc finger domain-containing protein [Phthorimaea operculella]|nr:u11-48K-like CHHC zinc finger domain-containing protein [Phthorimaea operculella]